MPANAGVLHLFLPVFLMLSLLREQAFFIDDRCFHKTQTGVIFSAKLNTHANVLYISACLSADRKTAPTLTIISWHK
jgi:hypothetical protein